VRDVLTDYSRLIAELEKMQKGEAFRPELGILHYEKASSIGRGVDGNHEGTDVGEALEPLECVDAGVD
jgi:hypothetical protein